MKVVRRVTGALLSLACTALMLFCVQAGNALASSNMDINISFKQVGGLSARNPFIKATISDEEGSELVSSQVDQDDYGKPMLSLERIPADGKTRILSFTVNKAKSPDGKDRIISLEENSLVTKICDNKYKIVCNAEDLPEPPISSWPKVLKLTGSAAVGDPVECVENSQPGKDEASTPLTIPDPALRAKIWEKVLKKPLPAYPSKPDDSFCPITSADLPKIEEVTTLDLTPPWVTDPATAIYEARNGIPPIKDLSGLSYFKKLTHLDVSNNNITSLDLSQNPDITYLDVRANKLSSLDVSPLTKLSYLDASFQENNGLAHLNIASNTRLSELYVENNKLKALDFTGTSLSNHKLNNQVDYVKTDGEDGRSISLSSLGIPEDTSRITHLEGGRLEDHAFILDQDSHQLNYEYKLAADDDAPTLSVKLIVNMRVAALTVKNPPVKLSYTSGERLDISGTVVTLVYDNGKAIDIDTDHLSDYGISLSPAAGSEVSEHTPALKFKLADQTAIQSITVDGVKKEAADPIVLQHDDDVVITPFINGVRVNDLSRINTEALRVPLTLQDRSSGEQSVVFGTLATEGPYKGFIVFEHALADKMKVPLLMVDELSSQLKSNGFAFISLASKYVAGKPAVFDGAQDGYIQIGKDNQSSIAINLSLHYDLKVKINEGSKVKTDLAVALHNYQNEKLQEGTVEGEYYVFKHIPYAENIQHDSAQASYLVLGQEGGPELKLVDNGGVLIETEGRFVLFPNMNRAQTPLLDRAADRAADTSSLPAFTAVFQLKEKDEEKDKEPNVDTSQGVPGGSQGASSGTHTPVAVIAGSDAVSVQHTAAEVPKTPALHKGLPETSDKTNSVLAAGMISLLTALCMLFISCKLLSCCAQR